MNDLEQLIALLAKLPGLGPRSARRAALHLLKKRDSLLYPLLQSLMATAESIQACAQCGNWDVQNPCQICADARRNPAQICVVEEVADLWAIERAHSYRGLYHVLGGTLSALDGIGPDALSIDPLLQRAANSNIQEVILATNATVQGQTTAHYLTDRLQGLPLKISRLAYGLPMGGELDYLDEGTLTTALAARQPF
jgi:recombination protein RecR